MPAEVEFGDEVKEYLGLKKESTAATYASQFRRFLRYYSDKHGGGAGFSHLMDRLDRNLQKPRRERKLLAELVLSDYIDHLLEEGYANNTVRLNFAAIQNLLKYKGYQVSGKWVGNLPPAVASKKNQKHEWRLEEIREFVESAPNYRDKAVILVMFQSGLAVRELCSLDYRDVEKELREDRLPLMLDVVREKTGTRYKTFLGADAVKHLKLYLETRKDLEPGSPLFTKWGSKKRITEGAIQFKFRELAEELSYIDVEEGEFNPARPHSMRSAFRSRLTGKMDPDLIEFFMGHTVSGTRAPYINLPDQELRELYASFENQLSIETTSKELKAGLDSRTSEIEQRYQRKIEDLETTLRTQAEQLSQLTQLNQKLSTEIQEMQSRVKPAEDHMQALRLLMENPQTREVLMQAADKVRQAAEKQSRQENQPNPASIK